MTRSGTPRGWVGTLVDDHERWSVRCCEETSPKFRNSTVSVVSVAGLSLQRRTMVKGTKRAAPIAWVWPISSKRYISGACSTGSSLPHAPTWYREYHGLHTRPSLSLAGLHHDTDPSLQSSHSLHPVFEPSERSSTAYGITQITPYVLIT